MKLLDLTLLCLASVLLLDSSYHYAEWLFADANNWIPSLFSDAVHWYPGKTFFWGVASILPAFFLCRFAARPMFTAFVVGIIMVMIKLYPSIAQLGIENTVKQLFSSYQTALDYLQIIGLLTIITWLLQWMIEPNREHEVIDPD